MTVNLAPADLPKNSGRFDLHIAVGILAASGQIDAALLAGWEFAGELSRGGELRPVRGALAMSLALHRTAGLDATAQTQLVLPPSSAEEAALVPQAQVLRAPRANPTRRWPGRHWTNTCTPNPPPSSSSTPPLPA